MGGRYELVTGLHTRSTLGLTQVTTLLMELELPFDAFKVGCCMGVSGDAAQTGWCRPSPRGLILVCTQIDIGAGDQFSSGFFELNPVLD